MTYVELVKRVEALESRLEIKETALNEALKTIEIMGNNQPQKRKSLSSYIDSEKYNAVFDFSYDKITGKSVIADANKKGRNFCNLYTNVMMACGYTHPVPVHGKYHARVNALSELKDNEYEQFGKLLNEIVKLIYAYKEATHG